MTFVFGKTSKSISTLFIEAIIVSISLLLVVIIIQKNQEYIPNITSQKLFDILLISGVIIHLGFEFTGINQWYSIEYCKLIQ